MTDEPTTALDEFESHRVRLHLLAQRMLGSKSDAEDAVQETWLRVARSNASDLDNVAGWLTTITARVCLNMLRSRSTRREDPFDDVRFDDVRFDEVVVAAPGPDDEAALAESVSIALGVVLESLQPAERLAFVLHDMFAMPFDDIAIIVDRSTAATRQLASRARRRVQGADVDATRATTAEQRRVVDAFFAAARLGRLDDLLVVLDPDIVMRNWAGPSAVAATSTARGAQEVAGRALMFARPGARLWPMIANGRPAVLATVGEQRITLMAFRVEGGLITEIDALTEPDRLAELDIPLD